MGLDKGTGHGMSVPLGYLLTWTTYGTWLPGDERGWVDRRGAAGHVPYEEPDVTKVNAARILMAEDAVVLNPAAREAVDNAIREVCRHSGWIDQAVSVRSNHVHVVVSAGDVEPGKVLGKLKAYGSRALNGLFPSLHRKRWWTEDGSTRYLNDQKSLLAAVRYVLHQDVSWMKEP